MISITHNRKKCIGCNACVEGNSARWRISRIDGKSVLIGATEVKGSYHLLTHEGDFEFENKVAKRCPVKVIIVNRVIKNEAAEING